MVNILVTGANGQLGSEFRALAVDYPAFSFYFTDVEELNITNDHDVREFFDHYEPDVVINCAGYTAVDKAEEEPEKAIWLNKDGVAVLSEMCDRFDSFLIHISTDYVFDGKINRPYRENDIPSPISVYGISKLDGEEAMMACLQKGLIIRTSWLYSSYGHNFVKTIIRNCRENRELNVVNDQIGTPTYARDLAETILKILPGVLSKHELQIIHYSNEGSCSWYEFAIAIAELAGIPCQINPVSSGEYPSIAPRPAYSVLDKSLIRERFGVIIPDWKVSLKKCIELIMPPNHENTK